MSTCMAFLLHYTKRMTVRGWWCQREHLQFILIIYRVTALYDSGDTGNKVQYIYCVLGWLSKEDMISIFVTERLGQYCYWSGRRGFFFHPCNWWLLHPNLAIASSSNFLCLFSYSRRSADATTGDLYGWPWCVTLTFQSFHILSHNSVSAGQKISKFLLTVA